MLLTFLKAFLLVCVCLCLIAELLYYRTNHELLSHSNSNHLMLLCFSVLEKRCGYASY